MADDLTTLQEDAAALDEAVAQARVELNAIQDAAATADRMAENDADEDDCSLHMVDGVGRYAIPTRGGWNPLLALIHDLSVDINFSTIEYPCFDKVLADRFNSAHLIDPLDDKYEHGNYMHLRENIAAVRNFLMQTYYADNSGMTPETAKQSLEEIANYLGEGLYNNELFLGVFPFHDLTKPFIDFDAAAAPNGAGAQYIYEQILNRYRRANWTRPFDALKVLFGGKPDTDWMLPEGGDTPFTVFSEEELNGATLGDSPTAEEIEIAMAHLASLENQRAILQQRITDTAAMVDLDYLGSHLVHTAEGLQDVQAMSEPVKGEAIELAKKILRGLRINLGSLATLNGINLLPQDGEAVFTSLSGVASLYQQVLAWGRGIDAKIMQDPSVVAASRAIGQLGYLAKLEALELANRLGQRDRASAIVGQLNSMPTTYRSQPGEILSDLLDRVERGIDTVLNRVVTISGPSAAAGHSRDKDLGNSMSGTPIAGIAMQGRSEGTQTRDAQEQQIKLQQAMEASQRAQLSSAQQVLSTHARAAATQAASTAATPPRGGMRAQLDTMRQRIQMARSATTTSPTTVAQQQTAQANALRQAHIQQLHHEEELHRQQAVQQQILAQQQAVQRQQIQKQQAQAAVQKAAAQKQAAIAAMKLDPNLLQSMRAATSTNGLTAGQIPTSRAMFEQQKAVADAAKAKADEARRLLENQPYIAPTPKPTGRGI